MAAKFPDVIPQSADDVDRALTGSVCPVNVSLGAVVGACFYEFDAASISGLLPTFGKHPLGVSNVRGS